MEGELVNVDGRSKVVVRLEMLGYAGVDMRGGVCGSSEIKKEFIRAIKLFSPSPVKRENRLLTGTASNP